MFAQEVCITFAWHSIVLCQLLVGAAVAANFPTAKAQMFRAEFTLPNPGISSEKKRTRH